jgi:sugar lactone lactonase YvrE
MQAPPVPQLPVSYPPPPYRIAIEHGEAYFNDYFSGRILAAPISGGPARVILTGLDRPYGIAVENGWVFWTQSHGNPGGVSGAVYAFDGQTKRALSTTESSPAEIVVGAQDLYWVNREGGSVRRVARGGGTPTTLASGLDHPNGIALDASFVYFSEWGSQGSVGIGKVPIAGGAVVSLAATHGGVTALAIDADSVYWTTMDGDVVRLSKKGGAPEKLATRQGDAGCLAVDAASVYWCDNTKHAILRRDKRTGAVERVGEPPSSIDAIALDATSLCWVDTQRYELVKQRK